MEYRRNIVVLSAAIFTIALLAMLPASLNAALALRPHHYLELETLGELGIACLAMIGIGIIVTWTGFIHKRRSAWFVLLIMVWGWAFPVMVLPFILHVNRNIGAGEWISGILQGDPAPRNVIARLIILTLMLLALSLPIKAFFNSHDRG